MSTLRLQIVDAIASAITAAATDAQHYRNLDYALEANKLPAIVVSSEDDQTEPDRGPISTLDQQVDIDIGILISKSANPEAAADPFEALIHSTLFSTSAFAGQSVLIDRVGGVWRRDLGDSVVRLLRYRVGYRTTFTSLEA